MKKEHKQKLNKVFNELTKLIQDIDEYYYQEYKKIINKNNKKLRRNYTVYDKKKQRKYPSINVACLTTGHDYRYIKNHPELYTIEEV